MFLPFESPSTFLLAGPSQSGKSTWVKRVIAEKDLMFRVPPVKVVYAYGAWQPMFAEMKDVQFHEGLPTQNDLDEWSGQHLLLILDDVMGQASNSPEIMSIFTVQCHHKMISTFYLCQNIFPPGRCSRTISLNCHYIILYKNKRDVLQIQTLGKQIFPGQSSFFVDAYQDAVSEPYGYLVCDLHPTTDKRFQIRTHIFPGDTPWIYMPYKEGETLTPWSFND